MRLKSSRVLCPMYSLIAHVVVWLFAVMSGSGRSTMRYNAEYTHVKDGISTLRNRDKVDGVFEETEVL